MPTMMASNMPTVMAQQQRQLTGDFMKDIAGRHITSDNLGSAKYWKDNNGVPMPDRSLGWLKFLTIIGGGLGLDHMYLRSPVTGFIKLITLGGFGIWYIWDVLQVFLEKERVLTYGLTAPFDIAPIGVGQGMITDKSSGYTSMASFPLFMLFTVFGFLGLDNFLSGQPGVGIRRIVDTGFFGLWISTAAAATSTVGRAILYFFAAIMGFFVIVPYLGNMIGLFTGYANGISYFNTGSILNWFMNVYDQPFKDDPSETHSKVSRVLRDMFGFEDRQREDIVKPFQVKDRSVTGEAAEQELGPWIPSVGLANPLGALTFSILNMIPLVGEGTQIAVRSMILEVPKEEAAAQVVAKKAKDVARAGAVAVGGIVNAAKEAAGPALDQAAALARNVQGQVQQGVEAAQTARRSAESFARNVQGQVQQGVEAAQTARAVAGTVQEQVQRGVDATRATAELLNKAKRVAGSLRLTPGQVPNETELRKQIADIIDQHGDYGRSERGLMQLRTNVEELVGPVRKLMSQSGGGAEPLSYEAKILGATIGALVVGGGIKGLVDHLMG